MKRKITEKLIIWKNDKENRMPLILYGARQVGKTYIINEFGKENYENVIYVNFETNVELSRDFDKDITPEYLIKRLEVYYNQRIIPEKTLIFLDEIQISERALTSLKYFCEDAPEYHIIAAGSLLGVAINRQKYSFPVGKVNLMTLFTMDFEEFLWASNREMLCSEIRNCYKNNEQMAPSLHDLAMELYKTYIVVGGMPRVVKKYLKDKKIVDILGIQKDILDSYVADMAKYTSAAEATKVMASFNSIPSQLAKDNKKFQYKIVQKGGTATIFGTAINWLCAAGVAVKCDKIEHAFMPPSAYQNLSSFKLYMSDIGLLVLKSGVSAHTILGSPENHSTFVGAVVENYVAIALRINEFPLYYWESDNEAEVDFIIQDQDIIIPVEVKTNTNTRSRSLSVYKNKYNPPYIIRISAKNFGFDNNIKSVPLYAVFCIEKV